MHGTSESCLQTLLKHGHRTSRVRMGKTAWACLTESMTNEAANVFMCKFPCAGWRVLNDWFLLKSLGQIEYWTETFDTLKLQKNGNPMNLFTHVDETAGVIAVLLLKITENEVNRNVVHVLTADYDMEHKTILYRGSIARAEVERTVRQCFLQLVVTSRPAGQALFASVSNSDGGGHRDGRDGGITRGRRYSPSGRYGGGHRGDKGNRVGKKTPAVTAPTQVVWPVLHLLTGRARGGDGVSSQGTVGEKAGQELYQPSRKCKGMLL